MQNRVRTTITLPDHLLQTAKISAVKQRKPLSAVIEEALEEKLHMSPQIKPTEDPMKLAGKYHLGIKKLYTKRSELYDDHLKRKMGV